ncbi:MAG: hydrolase [Thermodesulfovibrionales bacterium]
MGRFSLRRDEAVLVIVDVQERLASVMAERQRVVDNCLHLIEAARLLEVPVVVTEQYPKGLGPTVAEISGALPSYRPVEKLTFDCCGEAAFMGAMSSVGRKKAVLAGMESHICVLQTALGLLDAGYGVHAVGDAMCSRRRENHETALGLMRDAGAVITCTETALFQLLERAGTPEFKAISRRIK